MMYLDQTVIYLSSVETARSDYLIVVTRTSCILYSLLEDGVRRMTSYLLNSRKKPYRSLDETKFSYSVRFYFTAAKVIRAQEEADPVLATAGASTGALHSQSKIKQAGGGYGLLGSDFTMANAGQDYVSESHFEYQGLKTPEILVADEASQLEMGASMRMSVGGGPESSVQLLAQN